MTGSYNIFEREFFINEWHVFTCADACVFLLFTANIRAHSLDNYFRSLIVVLFLGLVCLCRSFFLLLISKFAPLSHNLNEIRTYLNIYYIYKQANSKVLWFHYFHVRGRLSPQSFSIFSNKINKIISDTAGVLFYF